MCHEAGETIINIVNRLADLIGITHSTIGTVALSLRREQNEAERKSTHVVETLTEMYEARLAAAES